MFSQESGLLPRAREEGPAMRRQLAPKDVRTFSDICKLKRDSYDVGRSYIAFNSPNEIVLVNQVSGKPSIGEVKFSRREFSRIVDWWNRSQKLRKGQP